MRMRYERRDPRPEDLRQIDELKSMVDSQEKDIFYLTEQLRELQLQQQQQQMPKPHLLIHQNNGSQQNSNQSKKKKNQNNNKTSSNNKSNIINNGNSNNDTQQTRQPAPEPQQIKKNANHKPPPLIKTIIYEEENENELYEQQMSEERDYAEQAQNQLNAEFEAELQQQQDGVTVELTPESPDYSTKNVNHEEISEAIIISDHNIPDVLLMPTPSSDDKLQEMRIEVISTIEPSNIQIVSNGHTLIDDELD